MVKVLHEKGPMVLTELAKLVSEAGVPSLTGDLHNVWTWGHRRFFTKTAGRPQKWGVSDLGVLLATDQFTPEMMAAPPVEVTAPAPHKEWKDLSPEEQKTEYKRRAQVRLSTIRNRKREALAAGQPAHQFRRRRGDKSISKTERALRWLAALSKPVTVRELAESAGLETRISDLGSILTNYVSKGYVEKTGQIGRYMFSLSPAGRALLQEKVENGAGHNLPRGLSATVAPQAVVHAHAHSNGVAHRPEVVPSEERISITGSLPKSLVEALFASFRFERIEQD